MGNQDENREFKNAARDGGVTGDNALNDCSEAFHNAFQRYEREAMSFQEIVEWARDWWQENGRKY